MKYKEKVDEIEKIRPDYERKEVREFQTIGDVEEAPPVRTNGRSRSAFYNP